MKSDGLTQLLLIVVAVLCVPFAISAARQYARGSRWVKGERFTARTAVATFLQLGVGLGAAVVLIIFPALIGKAAIVLLVVIVFRRARAAFDKLRR